MMLSSSSATSHFPVRISEQVVSCTTIVAVRVLVLEASKIVEGSDLFQVSARCSLLLYIFEVVVFRQIV